MREENATREKTETEEECTYLVILEQGPLVKARDLRKRSLHCAIHVMKPLPQSLLPVNRLSKGGG